jgi:hypothetical protein
MTGTWNTTDNAGVPGGTAVAGTFVTLVTRHDAGHGSPGPGAYDPRSDLIDHSDFTFTPG